MHLVGAQTKGGVAPATGLGVHGAPLQQLALDAQAPPALTHCAGEHRGTPTLSWWHVSFVSQLPLQQSHDELHDIVFSLHTSPSGLQPMGLRQTPTGLPEAMTQVTGLPDPPRPPVCRGSVLNTIGIPRRLASAISCRPLWNFAVTSGNSPAFGRTRM